MEYGTQTRSEVDVGSAVWNDAELHASVMLMQIRFESMVGA